MSEQNPFEGEKSEPAVDLSQLGEKADQAADGAATVVNQYLGTELKSDNVQNIISVVTGAAITGAIVYFATKSGVKSAMADYVRSGQSLVDAAGNYADIAQSNALVTAENAAKSHEVLMVVGETVNKFDKAVKNLKK